jgi:hypothetical protein
MQTTVLYALAMAHNNQRDRRRLQTLKHDNPTVRVITVSENLHSIGTQSHLDCNFASERGQRGLCAHIARVRGTSPLARIVVALDYFWLPTHYYTTNYGTRWLQHGAHALIVSGADEVLLPYDNGEKIEHGQNDMARMLPGQCHPGIHVEFVVGAENPLWVVTERAVSLGALEGISGNSNAAQTHMLNRSTADKTTHYCRCNTLTDSSKNVHFL